MSTPEFSHLVDIGRIGSGERHLRASEAQCAALARRFDLVSIDRLEAELTLEAFGTVISVEGRLVADIVQSCAVSGADLPVHIDEPLSFRFVPEAEHAPGVEIELSEADCDEIAYSGGSIDLGEAVAQSLALAIDPFAIGPEAERARTEAGILHESASGPFAALAALKAKSAE